KTRKNQFSRFSRLSRFFLLVAASLRQVVSVPLKISCETMEESGGGEYRTVPGGGLSRYRREPSTSI
ncbi:MAG TPA: hypothetical protein PLA90_16315, partial [Candidatus Sumerlaeota bacterium]|nr:hypothetical protein [Candidatus Sumerlaeota bacterium]